MSGWLPWFVKAPETRLPRKARNAHLSKDRQSLQRLLRSNRHRGCESREMLARQAQTVAVGNDARLDRLHRLEPVDRAARHLVLPVAPRLNNQEAA